MEDAARANISKYMSGTKSKVKREFVKSTPLRIVDNYTAQELEVLGMKKMSYPTPINPHK